MFAKRPLPFADFTNSLQTFDILLMHGLYNVSLAIESVEGASWSHSALVVVAGDLNIPGIPPDTRLLWESNVKSEVVDVLLNIPKQGPQLTRLVDRISYNYSTNEDNGVAARRLHLPQPVTPEQLTILRAVIQEMHSALFPYSPTNEMEALTNLMMGRFQNKAVQDNTVFCSQLVAHTYKKIGLMTQAYVDNSYMPADFSEALDVTLLTGWLGREIMLDMDTVPAWKSPGY